MDETLHPHRIAMPQAALDDLRDRLVRTRWPDAGTVDDDRQGVPLAAMRRLVEHWRDRYDWRDVEARLNRHPQIMTTIDGVDVHALHIRSPEPSATPLVLTHGWPGSVIEFLDVIAPLTDPVAHGGDPADAVHLVLPSVPGYGFSSRPTVPGWGIERIADAWVELMRRLGYPRFVAGGGDWGTSISTMIGIRHPAHVIGLHLTPPLVAPDTDHRADWTPDEVAAVEALERASEAGAGYTAQHATRPQTLAYALVDSPVGQAAWIYEKFRAWVDGDADEVLGADRILDDITLYWLTGTAGSSARLYAESIATVTGWFTHGTSDAVTVPTAASVFRDVPRPSRRWVERRFPDLRSYREPARGGHFAAFEQPGIFVDEVRIALRALRGPAATASRAS